MNSRKADWSKRTAKKTAGTTVALDDHVVLPVSPALAWSRLEDVPLVASCLPGLDPASLVAETESRFRARMVNTVMGISANWDLVATITPDQDRRVLQVVLQGEDASLNMKLDGTANITVQPDQLNQLNQDGQARLDYQANLRVDGSLAAMGGPVIRSILSDAIEQFVSVVGGQKPPERTSWFARVRARLRSLLRRRSSSAETSVSPTERGELSPVVRPVTVTHPSDSEDRP